MCGRYTQTADIKTLKERFGLSRGAKSLPPRFNIAPGQDAPVVTSSGNSPMTLESLRWGLVPSWAKDPAIGWKMINARSETAAQKPAFRRPFERGRCLVLADGFYEWKKAKGGGPKVPTRFMLRDGSPFAFAGLWDAWKDPEGKVLRTFAILTTDANALVRRVHPRMPVMLPRDGESAWLDPSCPPDRLRDLMAPHEPDGMKAYAVSTRVNSPKNDDPACVEPVEDPQPELGI